MVGILSGNAPIKGLIAGILGVFISTVGLDMKSGVERFAFNVSYFWEGIDLVLVALVVAQPAAIVVPTERVASTRDEANAAVHIHARGAARAIEVIAARDRASAVREIAAGLAVDAGSTVEVVATAASDELVWTGIIVATCGSADHHP